MRAWRGGVGGSRLGGFRRHEQPHDLMGGRVPANVAIRATAVQGQGRPGGAALVLDPIAPLGSEQPTGKRSRGVAILPVACDLQQACRVARHTAFVYLGRLVEENETAQLVAAPREGIGEAYLAGRSG